MSKRRPKVKTGPRAVKSATGHKRSKFNYYSRVSDGKRHPVTVRRIEDER